MLGFGEWFVIGLVVVLVVGIPRLPRLGEALGRAVKNYRRASRGLDEIDVRRRLPDERE